MSVPGLALTDRIVLKDGTIEESEKIWESESYIHFILRGTDSIEIRYAKEIVERVERSDNNDSISSTPKTIPSREIKPNEELKTHIEVKKTPASNPSTVLVESSLQKKYQKIIQTSRGISFYDPRRKRRYWASPMSQHKELQDALNALAGIYGRKSEWVEAHMGDENDLEGIHRNLLKHLNAEVSPSLNSNGKTGHVAELFFLDEGDRPYQVHPGQRYSNLEDAVSALSAMYGKPNAWIKKNMGHSNELNVIHQNLLKANSKNGEETQETSEREPVVFPKLGVSNNTLFYNPRRSEKYWTGKLTRHNSLKDAIHALAKQYNVSTEWIENHMGDTNLLVKIHQNIQKSLPQN
jgi:ribonuclease HI